MLSHSGFVKPIPAKVSPVCPKRNRGPYVEVPSREQTEYKPFTCQYCSQVFTDMSELNLHTVGHSIKTDNSCKCSPSNTGRGKSSSMCSTCIMGFVQLSDLQAHMKEIHDGETVYSQCFFCVRGFMKEKDLNVHITTHLALNATCMCV